MRGITKFSTRCTAPSNTAIPVYRGIRDANSSFRNSFSVTAKKIYSTLSTVHQHPHSTCSWKSHGLFWAWCNQRFGAGDLWSPRKILGRQSYSPRRPFELYDVSWFINIRLSDTLQIQKIPAFPVILLLSCRLTSRWLYWWFSGVVVLHTITVQKGSMRDTEPLPSLN